MSYITQQFPRLLWTLLGNFILPLWGHTPEVNNSCHKFLFFLPVIGDELHWSKEKISLLTHNNMRPSSQPFRIERCNLRSPRKFSRMLRRLTAVSARVFLNINSIWIVARSSSGVVSLCKRTGFWWLIVLGPFIKTRVPCNVRQNSRKLFTKCVEELRFIFQAITIFHAPLWVAFDLSDCLGVKREGYRLLRAQGNNYFSAQEHWWKAP